MGEGRRERGGGGSERLMEGWIRFGRAQARGDSEEATGGKWRGNFVCLPAIKAYFSV